MVAEDLGTLISRSFGNVPVYADGKEVERAALEVDSDGEYRLVIITKKKTEQNSEIEA